MKTPACAQSDSVALKELKMIYDISIQMKRKELTKIFVLHRLYKNISALSRGQVYSCYKSVIFQYQIIFSGTAPNSIKAYDRDDNISANIPTNNLYYVYKYRISVNT